METALLFLAGRRVIRGVLRRGEPEGVSEEARFGERALVVLGGGGADEVAKRRRRLHAEVGVAHARNEEDLDRVAAIRARVHPVGERSDTQRVDQTAGRAHRGQEAVLRVSRHRFGGRERVERGGGDRLEGRCEDEGQGLAARVGVGAYGPREVGRQRRERFDAALRVRTEPSGEDGLVMRRFAELCELLVASPDYLEQTGQPAHPDDLRRLSTLSFAPGETQHWTLNGPNGQQVDIEHAPRLLSHNFPVLRQAALDDLGIALLPASVIEADLASGRLVHVLPDWRLPQGVLHVVFPSRRGLLPAVRAFIDFLVDELPPMLQGAH